MHPWKFKCKKVLEHLAVKCKPLCCYGRAKRHLFALLKNLVALQTGTEKNKVTRSCAKNDFNFMEYALVLLESIS